MFRKQFVPQVAALAYSSDGDSNGLFHFLGTEQGAAAWANPQSLAVRPLIVTASGILGDPEDGVIALTDRAPGHFYTTDAPNSYVQFDLGVGRGLILNAYTYRSRSSFNGDHPTAWRMEGSHDGIGFTPLDARTVSITTTDEWLTTLVAGQAMPYRYFRWRSTAPSRLTASRFCASTANSIGSSRKTSLQKPFTIIDTASSALLPRCWQ
jgi:hypothetical protein